MIELKQVAIFGVLVLIFFSGCTSQNTQSIKGNEQITISNTENQNNSNSSPDLEVPPLQQKSAKDIVFNAKQNLKKADYQVTYQEFKIAGILTQKNTEAIQNGKFYAKVSGTTSFGISETYILDTKKYSCNNTPITFGTQPSNPKCIIDSSKDSVLIISDIVNDPSTIFSEDYATRNQITYFDKIISGKIAGRECDQIEVHTDPKNTVGKTDPKVDMTICLDKELGIPLYLRAISEGIVIETQAELVSKEIDQSAFTLPYPIEN